MAGAGVTLKGLGELKRNISQIGSLFEHELSSALEAGSSAVEGEAKRRCVVDYGRLRNSIRSAVEKHSGLLLSVVIGTNVEYAPYVEYGTGIYAENGQGRKTPWSWKGTGTYEGWHTTRGMPAQPFLRPALYSRQDEAVDVIRDRIEEFLKRCNR